MKKDYSRGFTLIELLVVIAIIGILSAVVLTSLGSARGKARIASVQQSLHALQSAAIICLNDGVAVTLPTTADNNTQSAAICTGSTATYMTLPSGWIWCDATAGTQAAGSNCGNEVSAQSTGVSFSLVAESVTDNAVVTCTDSTCTTATTNAD